MLVFHEIFTCTQFVQFRQSIHFLSTHPPAYGFAAYGVMPIQSSNPMWSAHTIWPYTGCRVPSFFPELFYQSQSIVRIVITCYWFMLCGIATVLRVFYVNTRMYVVYGIWIIKKCLINFSQESSSVFEFFCLPCRKSPQLDVHTFISSSNNIQYLIELRWFLRTKSALLTLI